MTGKQAHDDTPPLPDWEPELEFEDDPAENNPDAPIEDMPANEPEWRNDGDAETFDEREHDPNDEPTEP